MFLGYAFSTILQSAVEIGSEKVKYFGDQNGPQDRSQENKLGLSSSTKTFVCSNWKGKKVLFQCYVLSHEKPEKLIFSRKELIY